MKRQICPASFPVLFAVLCCAVAACGSAAAWGPQARQAIAIASINLVRQSFTASEIVYEADVLRGAADGVAALGDEVPLNSDAEAIDAVALQIIVLREAIRNGPGSHAAYRLGGLCALVSEIMVPYGLVYDQDERELAGIIQGDLEDQIASLAYSPKHPDYVYILNHELYFQDRRSFYNPDKEIISDDYARGKGKNGLLRSASKTYFDRSIEAATDVWYTVLHIEPGAKEWRPSNRQMASYYVSEIKYLLGQKKNFGASQRAYELFLKYDPGLPMSLLAIGDAYYGLGTEQGKLRGVEEWDKAYQVPGEARAAASRRLAKHYIEDGTHYFQRARTPEGEDTDLPNALVAFTKALRYDLSNKVAAASVTDTTKAIGDRKEELETQQTFFESAITFVAAAERSAGEKDFSGALTSYRQALNALEQVTPMFKVLSEDARDESGKINNAVKQVISNVYASANDSFEKGNAALLENNVDDAVRFYSNIASILEVVPAEEGSPNAQKKKSLVEEADTKIAEAEVHRKRLEQQKAAPAAGPPKKRP